MDDPTIASLLTIGGNALVVGVLMEVFVKRALSLTPAAWDRFGPAIAVATGIATGLAGALLLASPIPQAVLTGLFAGAVASGVYPLKNALPGQG